MLASTMESHQTSPFDRPSQVFRGIRFVLLGFDPIKKSQVSRKLVNGGGVDAGQYGPNCTHVIVDKLFYDDPMCVAARRDEKILVSSLWVDHSFDVGAPVDATSVMYRPVRDLNGIPGAKSLVICLTGYQRDDREDIMTMVELMGAQFSKPLIGNKVTHLICYKFEGEKYLLAKKMKRIKLINHQWLEDCLKAWEIVPESDYSKSGYELEMEAEAKDSEDEPEGLTARKNDRKITSSHHSLLSKQEIPKTVLNTSTSKMFSDVQETVSMTMKTTSDQFPNPDEIKMKHSDAENVIGVTCEPSNLYEKTVGSSSAQNHIISASTSADKSPQNVVKMGISAMRTTPPTIDMKSNTSSAKRLNKLNLSDVFNMSSSLVQKVNNENEQNDLVSVKRKMDITCGSFKLQKMSDNNDVESAFQELKKDPSIEMTPAQNLSSNISGRKSVSSKGESVICDVESAFQGEMKKDLPTEMSPAKSPPSNISGRRSLSSKGKNVICDLPIKKTSTSGIEDLDAVQRPNKENRETSLSTKFDNKDLAMLENVIESPSAVSSDIQKSNTSNLEINEQSGGSNSKPVRKKSISKKLSAPKLSKKNPVNRKGSIFMNNIEPLNDDENVFNYQNFEKVSPVVKSGTEIDLEVNNGLQTKNISGNKSLCMDDETEPPEDKDETNIEKHEDGGPENTLDILMEEKAEGDLFDIDQNNDKNDIISIKNKVSVDKSDDMENLASEIPLTRKGKKKSAVSVKEATDKKAVKNKELVSDNDNEKTEISEEATPHRAMRTRRNINDLEKSMEVKRAEGVCNDPEHKNDEKVDDGTDVDTQNVVNKKETKRNKRPLSKTKKNDAKAVNKKGKPTSNEAVEVCDLEEAQKENVQANDQSTGNKQTAKEFPEKNIKKANSEDEPKWFILTGHKLQRKDFQQIIRRLKGRVCRVTHNWSYQATHFIVPDPIRRTEKFFAAAASGRWILKMDYLSASNQAGKFLAEEAYEWHKNGLSEDGQINLEAPRKWRLLKEKTGHGAFYGMKIIIYGECIAPPLDTLKRAVKAGDGTILATSPPYTRFLNTGIDFAVVCPGMPHVDVWVQEFLKHEIPCVYADYLVEYVCKPGYPLERHVQYDTNVWAERSYNNLKKRLEEDMSEPRTPESNDVACEVCGSRDRGEEMLICGDENGSTGCGVGTHIDCCDPPLEDVPEEDWFCSKCSKKPKTKKTSKKKARF